MKHIGIAGNIGAGKTTLCEALSRHYGWEVHYEDTSNNPYLSDFYFDMHRWSFNLQVYFWIPDSNNWSKSRMEVKLLSKTGRFMKMRIFSPPICMKWVSCQRGTSTITSHCSRSWWVLLNHQTSWFIWEPQFQHLWIISNKGAENMKGIWAWTTSKTKPTIWKLYRRIQRLSGSCHPSWWAWFQKKCRRSWKSNRYDPRTNCRSIHKLNLQFHWLEHSPKNRANWLTDIKLN